jgi:molecular chaperone GrpE
MGKKEGAKEIPIHFVEKEAAAGEGSGEAVDSSHKAEPGSEERVERRLAVSEEEGEGDESSNEREAGEGEGGGATGESDGADKSRPLTVSALLGDIAELTQALSDARDQIDALIKEKSTLYDQMLRRRAEFENNRKRLDREKVEYYQRTRAEVVLELLPVLDNFDRALLSLEKSDGDAEALRHGVELIHKQLKGALTKLGLQPVDALGKAFDPNVHEAVTVEPTAEHEENTVIEELERGYKLGDRLLRPAKVKVATSPER